MSLTKRERELLTRILGLEGQAVEAVEMRAGGQEMHLRLAAPKPPFVCPECGKRVGAAHDQTERVVRDKPWADHTVYLHLPVVRIRCCRGRAPIELPAASAVKKNTIVTAPGFGK